MTPSTKFNDSAGNQWDCKINLGKALLVDRSDFKQYTSEKLVLSRFDRPSIELMLLDQSVMFAVIGVLVRDQAKDRLKIDPDLSPEAEEKFQQAFASNIDGSTIQPAQLAFVEALQDFFPAARTVLSEFLTKIELYRSKIHSRLTEKIYPLLDRRVDDLIQAEIDNLEKSLNVTSSPLPPQSESTIVASGS